MIRVGAAISSNHVRQRLQRLAVSNSSTFIRWSGCRHFSTFTDAKLNACIKYMEENGIDPCLHESILQSFRSANNCTSVSVQDLKSLGVNGLKSLAASVAAAQKSTLQDSQVKQQLAKQVRFVVPHHKISFTLNWTVGESLLDLAKSSEGSELLGEYIEGSCGGNMSCSTCHVYLDAATYEVLQPPDENEQDMLDMAYDPHETSRLGCQVVLEEDSAILRNDHAVTITIPADVNDMWK